jgi:nitroimidazol reductase NimA-like FMN-containing flavoprotein (pyridoxamine 5'-phosphate oxidase superfamily)
MTSEGFERLTEEECRQLLLGHGLGRIGFPHGNVTLVLPVYFTMAGPDIVFRTSPGAKLDAAVLNQRVAFEVDDEAAGWSVLVTGHADEVNNATQQTQALEALAGRWPRGMRERVVRISIENITGRRFASGNRRD